MGSADFTTKPRVLQEENFLISFYTAPPLLWLYFGSPFRDNPFCEKQPPDLHSNFRITNTRIRSLILNGVGCSRQPYQVIWIMGASFIEYASPPSVVAVVSLTLRRLSLSLGFFSLLFTCPHFHSILFC
jgi:hypothetical protein